LAAILLFLFSLAALLTPTSALATQPTMLGVHLLSTQDLDQAEELLKVDVSYSEDQLVAADQDWHLVTIPLTFADLNQAQRWQQFFRQCQQQHFIPIVRLATQVRDGAWQRPNRQQVVAMFNFLNGLDWPTEQLYVVVFNEVNHAKEWGGAVDAASYVEILDFAARWAHTEDKNYVVLPAALDLDAPNGAETMEAFTYLHKMYRLDPEIFDQIDVWNSHSYPNPGFSASPVRSGKNSVRGFLHELGFLKEKTGRDYQVLITETGWKANATTKPWLEHYYLYAMQHVWSHPQVIGVTPFVVKGAPGPFADFSFFSAADQPTIHYRSFVRAREALLKKAEKEIES
jgi:hypothetical protein